MPGSRGRRDEDECEPLLPLLPFVWLEAEIELSWPFNPFVSLWPLLEPFAGFVCSFCAGLMEDILSS